MLFSCLKMSNDFSCFSMYTRYTYLIRLDCFLKFLCTFFLLCVRVRQSSSLLSMFLHLICKRASAQHPLLLRILSIFCIYHFLVRININHCCIYICMAHQFLNTSYIHSSFIHICCKCSSKPMWMYIRNPRLFS